MGRVQGYRGGVGGRELRIAVQVSLDIYPHIGLAWASVERIPIEFVEHRVITKNVVVVEHGEVVNVEFGESAERHCCDLAVGVKGFDGDACCGDVKVDERAVVLG